MKAYNRMNLVLSLFIVALSSFLLCTSPADAATRADIVSRELDCFSGASKEQANALGMVWSEVCITNPSALMNEEAAESTSGQSPRSLSIQVDDEGQIKFYRESQQKAKAASKSASKPAATSDRIEYDDTLDKLDAILGDDLTDDAQRVKEKKEPLIQDRDVLKKRDLVEKYKRQTSSTPHPEEDIPIQHRDVLEDRDLVEKYKRQTSHTQHPKEDIPIQDRDVLEDRDLVDKYNKVLEPSPNEASDVELRKKDVLEDRDLIDQYENFKLNKATAPEALHLAREDPLGNIEFGTETYCYQYKEPNLMKDSGYLYGLYGTVNFRSHWNKQAQTLSEIFDDHRFFNYIKLDTRGAFGSVNYESTRTGTMNDLPYYTFEGRGLFGYDLPLWDSAMATPYVGFGWRYLYDDGGAEQSSTGHYSYDRESRYFYLPVGLELLLELKKDLELTMTFEYDFLISGRQKSHFDDLGQSVRSSQDGNLYTLDPLINKQEDGFGLRGSVKLVKKTTKFDFEFEPFVRYWSLENSDTKQLSSEGGGIIWYYDEAHLYPIVGYEPKNNTTEFGLKMGIRY